MRISRIAPALVAGALLVASTSPVQAQTSEVEGVGTTTGALTLLGLDAGSLLSLDLLSDAGVANIDEAAGARSAAAQIAALALESPVAGLNQTVPLFAVESTGDPAEQSQAVTPIDNPVVSGSLLPLSLTALVDELGASSSLTAGLADLDVLGGILRLAGTDLDLGSNALVGDATGERGVDIDALTVLDLEALLAALGIPLTDLSLDTLLGLLDGLGLLPQLEALLAPLGLDIDGLSVDAIVGLVDGVVDSLVAEVDTVLEGLDALEGILTTLESSTEPVCTLTDPVFDLLGNLLGGGELVCDGVVTDVAGTIATTTAQIDTLTDQLQALLDQVLAILEAPLDLLSDTSLLSLDGLDVNVVTKATDDVATSVADVTGSLGELQVGQLSLGQLDLAATTAQVDALLGQVQGAIGGVLGQIAPDLADLVSVTSMQESTSVVEDAGKVVATAAFTGLEIEVLPVLAELQGILAGLGGVDSIGATLEGLGLPIPVSGATEVLQVNSLISSVTGGLPLLGGLAALDEGMTVSVASISQSSSFAAAASPATPGTPGAPATPGAPTLPNTGSNDSLVLLLAAAAVLTALGGRHLARRSA